MKERIEVKGDFEKIMEANAAGLNLNEGAPGAMPAAMPGMNLGPTPGVTQVGGIIKTRKRKSHKKRKTRRNKRKLPFGKR
jgi:hypothetical protein